MTIKYECNKCGQLQTNEMFEITIRDPGGKTPHGYDERLDLCSYCLRQLNDFLKRSGP